MTHFWYHKYIYIYGYTNLVSFVCFHHVINSSSFARPAESVPMTKAWMPMPKWSDSLASCNQRHNCRHPPEIPWKTWLVLSLTVKWMSYDACSFRLQACYPRARTCARLLGPCFKLGRKKTLLKQHVPDSYFSALWGFFPAPKSCCSLPPLEKSRCHRWVLRKDLGRQPLQILRCFHR